MRIRRERCSLALPRRAMLYVRGQSIASISKRRGWRLSISAKGRLRRKRLSAHRIVQIILAYTISDEIPIDTPLRQRCSAVPAIVPFFSVPRAAQRFPPLSLSSAYLGAAQRFPPLSLSSACLSAAQRFPPLFLSSAYLSAAQRFPPLSLSSACLGGFHLLVGWPPH